ncbi:unnamed protein product, partial [Meganyctiphanes norvegica]
MADSGFVRLKWDYYRHNFSETLYNVKKKECYSDVTISCEGKLYRVHRLVIAMSSSYMDKLFQDIERTNSFISNLVVVLKDINSKELELLLDFIYAGEVEVLQHDLPGLIKAAEYLGIKGFSNSKDGDIEKSGDLESFNEYERNSMTKRPSKNNKDNKSFKKFKDGKSDKYQSSISEDTEHILSSDEIKSEFSQQVKSPIYTDSVDDTTDFNDTAIDEINLNNQDAELSSRDSFTKENSETNLSEPDEPVDFKNIKIEHDDDSSDIIIEEETISKPAIVPHFKQNEPESRVEHNKQMLTNRNQSHKDISFSSTSGLQWMDFDGGQSIQTNIAGSSNVGLHSHMPTFNASTNRLRSSPAWIGFDEIGKGKVEGSRLVKCKLCGIVKVSKGGNTTIMAQHIKVHHKNDGSGLCQKLEE